MQLIHANNNFFRQPVSPNIKSGIEQSLISGRKSWCSPHVAGWLLVTGVMTDRTQTINQNRPQIHTTFSLKLDFLLSDILFWVTSWFAEKYLLFRSLFKLLPTTCGFWLLPLYKRGNAKKKKNIIIESSMKAVFLTVTKWRARSSLSIIIFWEKTFPSSSVHHVGCELEKSIMGGEGHFLVTKLTFTFTFQLSSCEK